MSSWKVQIKADGIGTTAVLELIDTVGPLNEWRCLTADVLVPDKGDFMNQFKKVRPTEQPSWSLDDFDIDEVTVGQEGPGDMQDSGGSFPNGNMTWKVTAKL